MKKLISILIHENSEPKSKRTYKIECSLNEDNNRKDNESARNDYGFYFVIDQEDGTNVTKIPLSSRGKALSLITSLLDIEEDKGLFSLDFKLNQVKGFSNFIETFLQKLLCEEQNPSNDLPLLSIREIHYISEISNYLGDVFYDSFLSFRDVYGLTEPQHNVSILSQAFYFYQNGVDDRLPQIQENIGYKQSHVDLAKKLSSVYSFNDDPVSRARLNLNELPLEVVPFFYGSIRNSANKFSNEVKEIVDLEMPLYKTRMHLYFLLQAYKDRLTLDDLSETSAVIVSLDDSEDINRATFLCNLYSVCSEKMTYSDVVRERNGIIYSGMTDMDRSRALCDLYNICADKMENCDIVTEIEFVFSLDVKDIYECSKFYELNSENFYFKAIYEELCGDRVRSMTYEHIARVRAKILDLDCIITWDDVSNMLLDLYGNATTLTKEQFEAEILEIRESRFYEEFDYVDDFDEDVEMVFNSRFETKYSNIAKRLAYNTYKACKVSKVWITIDCSEIEIIERNYINKIEDDQFTAEDIAESRDEIIKTTPNYHAESNNVTEA